jgi:hypothetical protein
MTDHPPDAGSPCACICPNCRDAHHCHGVYCAHQHAPIHALEEADA